MIWYLLFSSFSFLLYPSVSFCISSPSESPFETLLLWVGLKLCKHIWGVVMWAQLPKQISFCISPLEELIWTCVSEFPEVRLGFLVGFGSYLFHFCKACLSFCGLNISVCVWVDSIRFSFLKQGAIWHMVSQADDEEYMVMSRRIDDKIIKLCCIV